MQEYIMRNAGLEEAQAGIKIARRNINNLGYADDTTLMAESEEELNLMIRVKQEDEKIWPKTQHLKQKKIEKLRLWLLVLPFHNK